ncbi:MAG: DegV family protein [Clostridia bacterium]|nr:DegV family protein [Clostridia bacterium]
MSLTDMKIVADSSADTLCFEGVAFASAPLKIITAEKEYTDDAALNVDGMVDDLLHYKGKSSTACPGPADWIAAFGDAKYVFCLTITSNLSGSYNAACIAKEDYESAHPDRKVFVYDSLSTGPEMRLVIEKNAALISEGKEFEEICREITAYGKKTGLIFMLESMRNLANNGRVSHLTAKAAGLLGIRAVGKASDEGTLQVLEKCRGEQKALKAILQNMKDLGMRGGSIKISHCDNLDAANTLKAMILAEFNKAKIEIYRARALVSFYAEKGGLLVGFEKN